MKKLFLVVCLATIGLSGCSFVPYRDHDDVYRGDRNYRDDGGHQQNDTHYGVGRQDDRHSYEERNPQKDRKGRNDGQDHDYGGDDHDGHH